jgi:hypothetical protein
MHDELFRLPAVVARYREGPYADSREQLLKQAYADGYSPSTLKCIARALLVVAKVVHRNGGSISAEQLKNTLFWHIRPSLTRRRPPQRTAAIFFIFPLRGSLVTHHRRVDGCGRSAPSVCVGTDRIF